MEQLVEAKKSSVLRLGIIGTGLWAKSDHLPALKVRTSAPPTFY
jgi:hypothetical protein